MTAVLPVASQRQQCSSCLQLVGIGGRISFLVLYPSQRRFLTFALEDLQLSVCSSSSSQVCYKRWLFPSRHGHTNRVCSQHPLDGESGNYQGAGIGHRNTDH